MTAYKDLVGQKITKVTSNPGEPKTGQMWYNSTDGALRGLGLVSAYASSAPMIVGVGSRQGQTTGSQTATLAFGGYIGPSGGDNTNRTDEYNGSGWSVEGTLNTTRANIAGCGTTSAAVGSGGELPPTNQTQATEEYNGTSWTSVTNNPLYRVSHSACGTQTAGLFWGGTSGESPGSVSLTNVTALYDGTNWTTGGTLGTSATRRAPAGTQTAAITAGGGDTPPNTANAEEYDGTSWSEQNNMSTARTGHVGAGIQTSAIFAGGYTSTYVTNSESYDGTSFSNTPALSTARGYGSSGGTSNTASVVCGGGYPLKTDTEEFTSSTNTITVGAWAAGASMNTTAYGRSACGTTTAGLVFGGYGSSTSYGNTETFDGSSFSEVSDMSTGRRYSAGFGTQTAAVCAGGNTPPGRTTAVEEWNGSSWGANPNGIPTALSTPRGTGTATAGLVFGGGAPSITANTQTFDGTSFTEVSDLNTARNGHGGAGTQTATLAYSGRTGPTSFINNTESWDGSSWTNSPTPTITARNNMGAAGTSTSALMFGGNGPTPTHYANFELYNGTTWITQPSMATARSYIAGFGTSASAFAAGGYNGSNTGAEEEFTEETSTANIADFTTS
jgi:hypothetical protein